MTVVWGIVGMLVGVVIFAFGGSALIAIYVWAGPHHLHDTALPDWVQSLGMVMSLVLFAPS